MSAQPRFFYTLVAYRENGVDTCRGCVMGQSDSDFELSFFETAEELAKHWARHMFTAKAGREYCSVDYTLLLNGRDCYNDRDDRDPTWDADKDCDPASGQSWAELERERVDSLVKAELDLLVTARERAEAEKAAAAEAAQRGQALRDRAAAELNERAEYKRLRAKFGGAA